MSCPTMNKERAAPYWLRTTHKFMALKLRVQEKLQLIFKILIFAISIVVTAMKFFASFGARL